MGTKVMISPTNMENKNLKRKKLDKNKGNRLRTIILAIGICSGLMCRNRGAQQPTTIDDLVEDIWITYEQGDKVSIVCETPSGKPHYLLWLGKNSKSAMYVAKDMRVADHPLSWARDMLIEKDKGSYKYTFTDMPKRAEGVFRCGEPLGKGKATRVTMVTQKREGMALTARESLEKIEAYDCDNGSVRLVGNAATTSYTRKSDVWRLGITTSYVKKGAMDVILKGKIYRLECEAIQAERVMTNSCYYNDEIEVKLRSGKRAMVDLLSFVVNNTAKIKCQPKEEEQKEKILKKVKTGIRINQALLSLGLALNGEQHVEASKLFNQEQIDLMNERLDQCVYGDGVILKFKTFYNKYLAGIVLIWGCLYILYTMALAMLAFGMKAGVVEALRLVWPGFKRGNELLGAFRRAQARKKREQLEQLRSKTGLAPSLTAEEHTIFHLGEIYESLSAHTERIEILEGKLRGEGLRALAKKIGKILREQEQEQGGSEDISSSSSSNNTGKARSMNVSINSALQEIRYEKGVDTADELSEISIGSL